VDVCRLTLKKSASKELQAVSGKETLDRLIKKIKELAINPRPQGSEKLAGRLNLHRFRQGDYRVIYSVGLAEEPTSIARQLIPTTISC